MKITVKYFGQLAEQTGIQEETLSLEETGRQVQELKRFCLQKHGLTEESAVQVAVNHAINYPDLLQPGDEVAFLPPYAGG